MACAWPTCWTRPAAAATRWPRCAAHGLHLEICPTSNLHTGAAASLALHPIHGLWRAGVSLSFHTDNRLMSRIDQTTEAANLVRAGFGWDELLHMGLDAVGASFLAEPARAQARQALLDWAEAEGLSPARPVVAAPPSSPSAPACPASPAAAP